jgi:2-dehydropantoate 2-reductase
VPFLFTVSRAIIRCTCAKPVLLISFLTMKVGVVGCGALGSFYGAKLCRDGQEVHFLLRSDYDVVRRRGVTIRSIDGDFHVNPRCARQAEEIGVCDVVFIGLKTTANDQYPALLPPLVGEHTAIVTLQNGLGNVEELARLFPARQILGGLCFVCLNRVEPGVVVHTAHGKIVLGEFSGWPEPRTHDIASMLRHAGIPCDVTDNVRRAHWEKLVWNIPFNGLGVASAAGIDALMAGAPVADPPLPCLATDKLLADPRWEQLVRELMREVIATAAALGLVLRPGTEDFQVSRTREMRAYKASTVIDFERGQALELETLFLEPLRQAQKAGVPAPRMQRLCDVLTQLDAKRAGLSPMQQQR